jgi:hypothetical protein
MTQKQVVLGHTNKVDNALLESSFKKRFGMSIMEFCQAETPAKTQTRVLRIEEAFSCVNCIVMDHVIAFLEKCGKDTPENRTAARLVMIDLSRESAN